MSKREEVNKTIHLFLRNAYEAGRAGRPLKEDEKVKGFLGALSLQDVVLKVEGKPTGIFLLRGFGKFEEAAEKNGYSATEPLIKEG